MRGEHEHTRPRPRDAVTGIPADYVESAIDHSLAFVATISNTDDIVAAWSGG